MTYILQGGYRLNKVQKYKTDAILVSIITIVYNGEKFLEQTIRSVVGQTYKNIEYIVVDGGSTDNTLEIIRKYEDKIAYWKSEHDQGISDAFNKGIALATGEIIGILNADDWFEPNAVASIVSSYTAGSVIHGNMQYWNQDNSKGMLVMPNSALLRQEMTINHPTVFVSRNLYEVFGGFSTQYKLAMDYHLLLKFHKARIPFIHVNETIANMRLGGSSSNWIKSYLEVRKAKKEVYGTNLEPTLFYYWQVIRRVTSSFIAKTPFKFVNILYRKHFSPMKKTGSPS